MKWIKTTIYHLLGILTILFFLFGQGVTWYAFGGDTEALCGSVSSDAALLPDVERAESC